MTHSFPTRRSSDLAITTAQGGTNTAKFAIGEFCDVFDENDRKVTPGSGVPGFIALMGAIPAGYYKDPVKSAKTFRTIDGVRYSIPGRSEEHTSELQSLMRSSYAVFCLKKKKKCTPHT